MTGNNNEALEILNRRLANGEITPDQYDELAARIGKADRVITDPKIEPVEPKTNSVPTWLGYVGIASAIFLVMIISQSTSELMQECLQSRSQSYCDENAVNGPAVAFAYLFFIAIGALGLYVVSSNSKKQK